MAAPVKPWERAGINSQLSESVFNNGMSGATDLPIPPDIARTTPGSVAAPPPLPPRPSEQTSVARGYGYGGGMSGMYGNSMYGGYGGMGYGGMGYGGGMYGGYGAMNRFGADSAYSNSSFARQAEENSRQAFQSVESVVQAFGSVAMMLDSTFFAVYNSFRAVIGVADQLSRVKAQFARIFSALAILKGLRWLVYKLLVFLRLRRGTSAAEAWQQASSAEQLQSLMLPEQDLQAKNKSSWPMLLFFGIVLGGPWLIWRLISTLYTGTGGDWACGSDDHFLAIGEHAFSAQSDEELSFQRGQRLTVAPKEFQPQVRGWLLASVDGKKTGMVPANYVKILGKRRGTRHTAEVTPVVNKEQSKASSNTSQLNLESAYSSNSQEWSSLSLDQVFEDSSQCGAAERPK